ncbi:MAG: ABC transporter permease [Muribaculaceae bacterium]|nr:ABC transporter permease [Muribaculaceae bacterium]
MMKRLRYKLRQLFVVYRHEFYLTFHDGGILLFFTFLPFIYPVLYSLIYNPEVVRDVKMVVVDHDMTASSRELVRRMDATQETRIIGYAADLNEGRRAMDSHACYAILEIPEGFERNIGNLETGNAVMYCEMSLLLRYRGFLVAATNVAMDMGAEITTERIDELAPLAETLAPGDMMPIGNVSLGNIENGFDSFIMPGIVILILHQCLILATCMAGGAKREDPRLIGYRPINEMPSVLMTMLGQMLCYMTIIYVPSIFLYHYVPMIFRFPVAGDPFAEMAFILPMVLAALSLGFIIQGFVAQRESVFVFWVITSVMFLFLSGLTWPRFAMPGFWKFVSDLIPATWGMEGFIRMNTNGSTLAQVRDPYIYLWIQAVVYFAIAYCVHRWVIRPKLRPFLKVSNVE